MAKLPESEGFGRSHVLSGGLRNLGGWRLHGVIEWMLVGFVGEVHGWFDSFTRKWGCPVQCGLSIIVFAIEK
jgi:hypothetical protein